MKDLNALLKKAAVAQPPEVQGRSTWMQFLPVVNVLTNERAFTVKSAVDWLVAQGEIPTKKATTAHRALRQLIARREAKKSRQTTGKSPA